MLRQFGGRRSHGPSISSDTVVLNLGQENQGSQVSESAKVSKEDATMSSPNASKEIPPSRSNRSSKHDGSGAEPHSHKSAKFRTMPPNTKQAAWRRKGMYHRLSESGSKDVEDFTSVRRTGVDWSSLIEPACLPVTVDYFPSKMKLEQDYYESPSKLVVSSFGSDVSSSVSSR